MSINKKFLTLFTLVLFVLLCAVSYADNKLITEFDITVPDFYVGDLRPRSKDIKASSKGVFFKVRSFKNLNTDAYMQEDDKFEKDTEYLVRLGVIPEEGYEFANLIITINGEKVTVDKNENTGVYYVEKVFDTIPRPKAKVLKSVEFEIPGATEGEKYADSFKVKTNLSGKFEKVKFGRNDDGIEILCTMAGQTVYTSSFQINCSIDLDQLSDLYSPTLVELDDDLVITINGEEIEYRVSKEYSMVTFIEWVEPEWTTSKVEPIDFVELKITTPKVGEKPATTAEATNKAVEIRKVEWEPADEVFAPGKAYTVKIYYSVNRESTHRYLAEEVSTTVNNMEAKYAYRESGYAKLDVHTEFTFPKLEGEVVEEQPKEETEEKVEWSNASKWAEEELTKANEKKLIPKVFEKQDLTTSVTRREFSHVAVKLWEELSGQTMAAGPIAPFTDCDDPEVLKAYNLEITKGISDTTFSPDELITREQMATMMTRALAKAGIDVSVDLDKVEKFADDNDIHSWGKEAVYYMASIGIIKGVGNNNFGVTGDASKEQSLLISVRSAEKLAK